ncbi:PAS domain-containing protein [Ferrovibrio sp.]|uniref:PAS domain-containing protein n=1 Tax=Ferrovibrio sp. TaxID=1917215 RepID=UPI000CB886BC|nr:PAS domain-containing protein [Ferrovibrio sp.]PJI37480.1 MAG: hypothetical protein CTR53_20175 [Ferrovibrio sp.]
MTDQPPSDLAPSRSTFSTTASQLRRDFTAADCREPAIGHLYDYWQRQRGTHRFPARGDLDPIDMKPALGGITIFEIHPKADGDGFRFRYRLIGSAIVARDGFDMTGRFLDELPLMQYRTLLLARLDMLARDPSPMLVHNKQFYDERWYDYEAIWLPLATDHENIDMLMACQIFARKPSSHVGLPVV